MSVTNIIIIVIIIVVLLWALNNIFLKTNIIYDIMCDASAARDTSNPDKTNTNVIVAKDIPENNSSNFMLSVWFYIDNWGDNISSEKNILYMATDAAATTVPTLSSTFSGVSNSVPITPTSATLHKNINIALDKYENNLFIDIETTPDLTSDNPSSTFQYTRYRLPNISIQKWNNLTISIDSRTLDVYLDGKLRNSFILKGLYRNYIDATTKKNIYIGNMKSQIGAAAGTVVNSGVNSGFEGFITRIRYESFAINPQEAYDIYKKGINSSLANSIYNRYRLKVSFLEYNKEKGSITI
jgi:hypothetical protein